jgi:hypothetical protein
MEGMPMRTALLPALAALLLPCAVAAQALEHGAPGYRLAPRIALVIGVSNYLDTDYLGNLKNPGNDGDAIAAELRRLNFTVLAPHENYPPHAITRQLIKQYLYDFAYRLRRTRNAVGLVYFSGHGVLYNNHQYLAPSDAYVRFDRDLAEELVPLQWFFDAFSQGGSQLNLLYIDACRNVAWPSLPSFGRSADFSSAIPESPVVTTLYATLSGLTASDGSGNLSPFAAAFVDSLKVPDRPLSEFHSRIREKIRSYDPAQEPMLKGWDSSFTYYPTTYTFDLEFGAFEFARRVDDRNRMEALSRRFAHGYVGRAAERARNDSSPRVTPAGYVEIVADAQLFDPQGGQPLGISVTSGSVLALAEQSAKLPNAPWVLVQTPDRSVARISRPSVAETVPSPTSILVTFPDSTPGTAPELDAETRKRIQQALGDRPRSITAVEINSYAYSEGQTADWRGALGRGQRVMQAIVDGGVPEAILLPREVSTNAPQKRNQVEVTVTVATRRR